MNVSRIELFSGLRTHYIVWSSGLSNCSRFFRVLCRRCEVWYGFVASAFKLPRLSLPCWVSAALENSEEEEPSPIVGNGIISVNSVSLERLIIVVGDRIGLKVKRRQGTYLSWRERQRKKVNMEELRRRWMAVASFDGFHSWKTRHLSHYGHSGSYIHSRRHTHTHCLDPWWTCSAWWGVDGRKAGRLVEVWWEFKGPIELSYKIMSLYDPKSLSAMHTVSLEA